MRSACSPSAGRETATVDMPGALYSMAFAIGRRATVTDCDAQSVISRLLCAHIAEPALNGMVLLGEGGRVQIAVLCSTLGLGIGRCGLAYQASGRSGRAGGCGPGQRCTLGGAAMAST
jgi:hypothetical protein